MFMTPGDFRGVRAAVVESNAQLRSDMRFALLEKGIREPAMCRTADSFLEIAGRENFDLIVCESGVFDGAFAPTMQRMRRNGLGGNPFAVTIATMHEPQMDRVQDALSGGIDDLMCRPAPAKKIADRIDVFLKDRKPFIATRNYVGPTRANLTQANDEVGELIEVPNTLRSKVVHKITEATLRRQVAKAAAGVEERIAEHPLAGLDRLIRRALAWQGRDEDTLRRDFGNLQALCVEMSGHYRSSADSHIADLALALSKLAKRVVQRQPPEPTRTDLDLLRHLGAVVRRSISVEAGSQSVVREIAAMVDRYSGVELIDEPIAAVA